MQANFIPQTPQLSSSTLNSSSPDLISATDLAQWADQTDSKTAFPELIRRLLAQTAGITNIEMRANEGTSAPGWDGRATSAGSAYLPAGELRFEVGTNKKVKVKADSDYAKRVKKLGKEAHHYVYIFATPRDWSYGQQWADDRRKERKFADVKVIDAHSLEGWLQATPAVHYWISERLGRQPRDVSTLSAWWQSFQSGLSISIPPRFFRARRSEQARKFLSELQVDHATKPVSAASTCIQDVLAFVYAVLIDQPELADRAVVVNCRSAWSRLVESAAPLLLISCFSDPNTSIALDRGHRVLATIDSSTEYSRDNATISLPKIGRQEAAEILREADVDFRRAERLVALARRSMAAFIRSISRNSAKQKPAWLSNADTAAILAPLVLIGAWEDGNARDEEYIQAFVDTPMADIRRRLISLSRQADAPFVQSGLVWRLVDPIDAAQLLLPVLDRDVIQRWEGFVHELFLAGAPYRGMDTSEQLTVQLRGVKSGRSDTLRNHVAEGLALAAVSLDNLATTVRGIVERLLDKAFADSTGEMLANLAPVFPLLAEAEPDKFLAAVASDLDKSESVARTLFQESEGNVFGPSPLHPYLLWALEHLCWSSDYYVRAAMALAAFADIDPGGRHNDRPIESLEKVTAGPLILSAADVKQKTLVIDAVTHRFPNIGWKLLLDLLQPQQYIVSGSGPRYRNWELSSKAVTYGEMAQYVSSLTDMIIEAAGERSDRLVTLIDAGTRLPIDVRKKMLERLASQAESGSWGSIDRHDIWAALTRQIHHRQSYPDAEWSMSDQEIAQMEEITHSLEASNDPRRHSHLFRREMHIVVDGLRLDDDGFSERLNNARLAAIEEVVGLGAQAILCLSEDVERPDLVGTYLAMTQSLDDINVLGWLDDTSEPLQQVAFAYAQNRINNSDSDPGWMKRMLDTADLSMEGQERLVAAAPMAREYWSQVFSLDEHLVDAYWSTANCWHVPDEEQSEAVDLLVRHGHHWRALDLLSLMIYRDSSCDATLVKRVLTSLVTAKPNDDVQHYSCAVSETLKWLESTTPDDPDLPELEFQFFDFVGDHEPSDALYRALGASPSDFVHLMKAAYRLEEDAQTTPIGNRGAYARRAMGVLWNWSRIPGLCKNGSIDADHLASWVKECRERMKNCEHFNVVDNEIGNVLSCCTEGKDHIWPAEEVRDVLEALKNSDIEKGFARGCHNQRRVATRGVYDGGERERTIAQQYRTDAERLELRWPRTANVLRGLADDYESYAKHIDKVDERDADEG